MALAVAIPDYALNLTQAYVLMSQGFLPAIFVRVVFYLVWHVVWGLR